MCRWVTVDERFIKPIVGGQHRPAFLHAKSPVMEGRVAGGLQGVLGQDQGGEGDIEYEDDDEGFQPNSDQLKGGK